MADATEARDEGRFQGMVLERLDTAVSGIASLRGEVAGIRDEVGGIKGRVAALEAARRASGQDRAIARTWWQHLLGPIVAFVVGVGGVLVGVLVH